MTDGLDDEQGMVAIGPATYLVNTHPESACATQGWGCWIHRPIEWALSSAPLEVRDDQGYLQVERLCEHDVGHPDLQDAAYNWMTNRLDVTGHGCDGCCGEVPAELRSFLPSERSTTAAT